MKRRRQRYNNNVKEDRLSNLPDFLLLHILSFVDTKHAVQTCILSTRWKNIWKHLPTLTLHSSRFRNMKDFTKFVSRILSLREESTTLQSLDFQRSGIVEPHLLKRIVKYVVSHNVQRLRINIRCDFQHFQTCLFSCHTLTSLDLSVVHSRTSEKLLFPSSLNLPALTSLSLQSFAFPVGNDGRTEPFMTLQNLNSLIIRRCKVIDAHTICISSATLANLTLETHLGDYCEIELSTPSLCTFVCVCIEVIPTLKLCASKTNLSSVKHVAIHVFCPSRSIKTSLVLLNWLVELSNIKSLIINSSILEVLSLVPDLLKVEFRSFCNLKSLKVHKYIPSSEPNGVLDFLLQNSPTTKAEIINLFR
ncbi:F-box/FBD/LRR-repeat protein At1g78750-like [Trifolium pratense]|uniref:F-box/FBD/LRR-repeat protein At1g78750-like n=1 Tax=Trifolium pratense TaxID=57577 RepID=UPI001E695197|nr:F-box/FBD/LRR-repeat protein At1g78750-like [Trifolium pratense]